MEEKEIGIVSGYFSHVKVAAIKLSGKTLLVEGLLKGTADNSTVNTQN